jgi:cobalt-precorrin-7 (C5)-methyltransferase
MEMGWPEDAKAAICARLSYEDERVVRTTLAGAATEKEETHCVMVVMG